MAKQAVALRLAPEKIAAVDEAARLRGVSRQFVLEEAVDAHLSPRLIQAEVPPVEASRVEVAARAAGGRVVPAASLVARQRANPQGMTRQERVNRLGQGPKK